MSLNLKRVIAVIEYHPEEQDGQQLRVGLTELSVGMLSTLTDFELKVFATEVGLAVRKRFEMPPSPPSQRDSPQKEEP